MKAKEFTEAWEKFAKTIVQEGEHVGKLWHQNAEWTKRVTGPGHASEKDSPLGNFLKGRLNNEAEGNKDVWRYRTEEWKLDLVLAKKKNIATPKVWNKDEWEKEWSEIFWPATYEIIIEHESSCGFCWQEMAKLIHLRSRLKVLITYTYDLPNPASNSTKSQDLIDETHKQFEAMLKAAWKNFPENWDTEYLLIVGQLDERGNAPKVNWHYTVYAPWGERSCEHPSTETEF